jgi:hypothetical protein
MSITTNNITHTSAGSGTSLSVTHNHNGDTLRVDVGNADGSGGHPVQDCRWNTTAGSIVTGTSLLPAIYDVQGASYFASASFLLPGATTGSHECTVFFLTTVGAGIGLGCVSHTGVDQVSPNGTPSSTTSTANQNPTISPASSVGDLVVGSMSVYSTSVTSDGAQSSDWKEANVAALISVGGDEKAGASTTTTLLWTGGGGGENKWAAGGYALKAAAGGGGTDPMLVGAMCL